MDSHLVRCIYCLELKSKGSFRKREHVIPQGLGRFKNNLVLHKAVCDKCNQYFGDNIELALIRDTAEGVYRYTFGIRPKQEPKHRRISFRVAEGQELEGIHVSPSPRQSTIADVVIEPVAQAGFYQKETGKWLYFKADEIPEKSKLAELGLDVERGVELIVRRDEDLQSLLKSLEDKGIRIEAKGKKDWPESVRQGAKVVVLGDLRIDRLIYRALCKIAFNYFRFIVGHNFVLHEDFNPIRRFIRYDEGQSTRFFSTGTQPILYDEALYGVRLTEGHLIVIEWRETNLACILRLFNMFTYLVVLCRTFSGIWIPIASGHHFDPKTKKVSELLKASKNLMPN